MLLIFLGKCKERSEKPDEATVVSSLSACTTLKILEVYKEIHDYVANELEFTTVHGEWKSSILPFMFHFILYQSQLIMC